MNWCVIFIGICMIFATANSLPGGWSKVSDLNSPEIQKNGHKAVSLLSNRVNSPYLLKMMNITDAETQVVSGKNYRFKMSIGQSQCKKSENLSEQEIQKCPLQKCKSPYNCSITMYVQPWTNTYKLTNSDCEGGKSRC